MKQLTCEMCGSTDLIKQDGVFVCQLCGTKYSVEEAKEMMIEGVVEISGTVKIDDTDKASTYISMAENACAAGNYAEAESYCNKVIEIEPENYKAWILKGNAAGRQSSMTNIRISEARHCYDNALRFVPVLSQENDGDNSDEIRERIVSTAWTEIGEIIIDLIKHQSEAFDRCINDDEKYNMIQLVDAIVQDFNKSKEAIFTLDDIIPTIERTVCYYTMLTWNNKVVSVYQSHGARPDQEAAMTFAGNTLLCEEIIIHAIALSKNNNETDILLYNSIIMTSEAYMKCIGWKYHPEVNKYTYGFTTFAEAEQRKALIAQYKNRIELCKKNISQKAQQQAEENRIKQEKKNQEYWINHADEKIKLESERDSLQSQLKQLQDQFAPYEKEINSWKKRRDAETPWKEEEKIVKKHISDLEQQKSNLGMFKGKEKKSLQAQIDELNSRLPKMEESIAAEEKEQIKMCNGKIREIEQQAKPIKDKIAAAEKRINEIKAELTKNR